MTETDFTHIIMTYGSKPDNWPADRRADMEAFIAAHPNAARPLLARESALDTRLDDLDVPAPGDLLKARILKAVSAEPVAPQPVPATTVTWPWGRIAVMMLFAFSAGFGGAQFVSLGVPGDDAVPEGVFVMEDEATQVEWQFAATELGVSDVYEWASGETISSEMFLE